MKNLMILLLLMTFFLTQIFCGDDDSNPINIPTATTQTSMTTTTFTGTTTSFINSKPEVKILSPQEGDYVGNKYITITGTAYDEDGIYGHICMFDGNNVDVIASSNSIDWTATASCDISGYHTIAYQAIDTYGNKSDMEPISVYTLIHGDEFQVNIAWLGDQKDQNVVMDDNGNFIVVWQNVITNGDWSIRARKFSNNGIALSNEFKVNVFDTDKVLDPVISMNNNSDFVVVWSSKNQDGDGEGVYGRKYDIDCNPLTNEFQINNYTIDSQVARSMSMDGSGNFVVTWEQEDFYIDIKARIFDSNCQPLTDDFVVNSGTNTTDKNSCVSMNDNGNFIVAWERNSDIYARKFDISGSALSNEFVIHDVTDGNQWRVSSILEDDENVVFTYYGPDSDEYGIYIRKFDPLLNPVNIEKLINSYENYSQSHSHICKSNNKYILTWSSDNQDGDEYGVYARLIDKDLTFLSDEFLVNTTSEGVQGSSKVCANSNGDIAIIWNSIGQDGELDGLFGQIFRDYR